MRRVVDELLSKTDDCSRDSKGSKTEDIESDHLNDLEKGHFSKEKMDPELQPIAQSIIRKLKRYNNHHHQKKSSSKSRLGSCCRVPMHIRESNEDAYTPRVVSIGPYHHGNSKYSKMEDIKMRYLFNCLEIANWSLEELVHLIMPFEEAAREFYTDMVKPLHTVNFMKMLVTDSVFVLQILLYQDLVEKRLVDDNIVLNGWLRCWIEEDLKLIENQIPCSILVHLKRELAQRQDCFRRTTLQDDFARFIGMKVISQDDSYLRDPRAHLVDLLRLSWVVTSKMSRRWKNHGKLEAITQGYHKRSEAFNPMSKCATRLQEAGVTITPRSDYNTYGQLEIEFRRENGVLEMAPLTITHEFERTLRNLMIYEMQYCSNETYIIDYVGFLNSLIRTPDDVDLLENQGVITNLIGSSDAVLAMFNDLTKALLVENSLRSSYFGKLSWELERYDIYRMGEEAETIILISLDDEDSDEDSWASQPLIRRDEYYCCCSRVPLRVRKLNEGVYTPRVLSIGPYHYGRKECEFMQQTKLTYLARFCWQFVKDKEYFLIEFDKICVPARNHYREWVKLNGVKIESVLLRDGVFLIMHFLDRYIRIQNQLSLWYDKTFLDIDSIESQRPYIYEDLQLVENQIPHLILEGLYNRFVRPNSERELPTLHAIVRHYFGIHATCEDYPLDMRPNLIHILRFYQLPQGMTKDLSGNKYLPPRCATKLQDAGVRIKLAAGKNSSPSRLDIKFNKESGVLTIPQLVIDAHFVERLRNLMAYELQYNPSESYITHYVWFLDSLINTTEDVDLLKKLRIITNSEGSSPDVAKTIKSLTRGIFTKGTTPSISFYTPLCYELEEYCSNPKILIKRIRKWMADLLHVYFKTPWSILGIVVGFILLVLTFTQTVKAFY